MAGLFDLFDALYTNVLKCNIKELDTFSDKASDEEIDKLNDIVWEKGPMTDEDGHDKVASEEDRAWFLEIVNRKTNGEAKGDN